MSDQPMRHVIRPLTDEERARHAAIRAAAVEDFPPKSEVGSRPSPAGIPAAIRRAREAQGLTWYALAQAAGLPTSAVVRAIEEGKDAQLSDLQAIVAALGLQLELVEQIV